MLSISERILDRPLAWGAAIFLVTCSICAVILALAIRDTVRALPAEAHDAGQALYGEVLAMRQAVERVEISLLGRQPARPQVESVEGMLPDLVSRTDKRVGDTLARLDRAITLLEKTETDANRHTGTALAIVKDAAALTVTEVQGLRSDLKPTLANVAAFTATTNQFIDETYLDLNANVQSATVALASLARASEAVARAAPDLSVAAVGIGKSVDGIASDAHALTADFVRPRSTWEKIKSYMGLGGKIATGLLW